MSLLPSIGLVGMKTPTYLPKTVDSWEYASMLNEGMYEKIFIIRLSKTIQKSNGGVNVQNYQLLSSNGFRYDSLSIIIISMILIKESR